METPIVGQRQQQQQHCCGLQQQQLWQRRRRSSNNKATINHSIKPFTFLLLSLSFSLREEEFCCVRNWVSQRQKKPSLEH